MFNFSKKKKEPENIAEVLTYLKKIEKDNINLKLEIEKLKKENISFIRKTDVIRYNPFSELGGNQSFSALFLDKENNGLIITGLFTENGSRVYGKSIEKGISKYSLSKEEENLLMKNIEK